MPGTTPRGYPFPLPTEPADGAPQIEALARAIDTDNTAIAKPKAKVRLRLAANTAGQASGIARVPITTALYNTAGGAVEMVAGYIKCNQAGTYLIGGSIAMAGMTGTLGYSTFIDLHNGTAWSGATDPRIIDLGTLNGVAVTSAGYGSSGFMQLAAGEQVGMAFYAPYAGMTVQAGTNLWAYGPI